MSPLPVWVWKTISWWKIIKGRTPTSLISLIFEPPLPIREPHWLPGKTRRRVTGGLLVTLLFVMAALISWGRIQKYVFPLWQLYLTTPNFSHARTGRSDFTQIFFFFFLLGFTSSNLAAIMEKALKMPSVGPVMVTILSGDEPSDMLMRAPLWKHKFTIIPACLNQNGAVTNHKWSQLKRGVAWGLTSSLIFFTVSPFWTHSGN